MTVCQTVANVIPLQLTSPGSYKVAGVAARLLTASSSFLIKLDAFSERSLTESQSFIYDFVDISHVYGYGYQMNTGIICFVFNDRSSMYFEDQSKKNVVYINEKKQLNEYQYEKFP